MAFFFWDTAYSPQRCWCPLCKRTGLAKLIDIISSAQAVRKQVCESLTFAWKRHLYLAGTLRGDVRVTSAFHHITFRHICALRLWSVSSSSRFHFHCFLLNFLHHVSSWFIHRYVYDAILPSMNMFLRLPSSHMSANPFIYQSNTHVFRFPPNLHFRNV